MAYSEPSIRAQDQPNHLAAVLLQRGAVLVLAAVIDDMQNAPQQFAVFPVLSTYCRAVQRQSLAVAIGRKWRPLSGAGGRFGVDRVLFVAPSNRLKTGAVDQGFQVGLPGVDSQQIALASLGATPSSRDSV